MVVGKTGGISVVGMLFWSEIVLVGNLVVGMLYPSEIVLVGNSQSEKVLSEKLSEIVWNSCIVIAVGCSVSVTPSQLPPAANAAIMTDILDDLRVDYTYDDILKAFTGEICSTIGTFDIVGVVV